MNMTIQELANGIEQIYDADSQTQSTDLDQVRASQSQQLAALIGAFVIGRTTIGTDSQGNAVQTIVQ